MNVMLEPFFYEAVVEHQDELREAARMSEAPGPAKTPLPARSGCFRVHRASRDDRATVIPCLSRLLWKSR
jgi:hypothetical protein